MDEIHLGPEATELASRIRTIDRDLDSLERSVRESVIRGLHSWGGAMAANLGQTAADKKRADLLSERAQHVERLRALVGEDPSDGNGATRS